MSYDVQLFRKETKLKEQKLNVENFFDDEKNLETFTEKQMLQLKDRLLKYDYEFVEENKYGINFKHSEYGNALLTKRGLYFSTIFDTDCIFEVGMIASELTDTGEFEKFDPQNNGWEEV